MEFIRFTLSYAKFSAFHISRVCVCVFMHECFCVCVTTAVQSKSTKSNVSAMAVAASDSAASTIILCLPANVLLLSSSVFTQNV